MNYEFSGTKTAISSIIVKVWAITMDFIGEHLSDKMTDSEEYLISDIRKKVIENIEFVNNRQREIAPILEEKSNEEFASIIECPACFEKALVLSEEIHICAFCGYDGPYTSILDNGVQYLSAIAIQTQRKEAWKK